MTTTPRVPDVLTAGFEDVAESLLRAYSGPDGSRTAYTGAHFETLGSRWDDLPSDKITPADLLAVSTLSVVVPASASIQVLGEGANQISRLLAQIPRDVELSRASDDLVDGGAPLELWRLLRALPGMGPTITSVIARKRPRLVPICDTVLASAYGIRHSAGYWRVMRELVCRDGIWDRASRLGEKVGLDPSVTPLRVIDVAVWMQAKRGAPDSGAAE